MTAPRPFSFVQITDIHVGFRVVDSAAVLAEDLRQVCAEVGDRAAFIVATGDLTNRGTEAECRMYVEATQTCPLRIHPVVGNHDYLNHTGTENKMDAGWYQALISPLDYAFDHEGVHFVSYDYAAKDNSDRPSQWLLDDLSAQPPGTPVIFLVHHQLHASFYDQLSRFRIVATLSGHWHSSRLYHDGRIAHFNGPSLCFGGIDYSPRAYRVFHWDGTKLSCETVPFKRPNVTAASRPRRAAVHWQAPLRGEVLLASPVLVEKRLCLGLMDENRAGNGAVACWDAGSGKELWRTRLAASVKNNVAVADETVFAVTVTGEVVALAAASGARVWSYQLGDASQRWIFSSPCVHNGVVYAGQGPHFAALQARTGKAIWVRADLTSWDWISSYVSPACDGQRVYIGFHWQPNSLQALDVATGQTVWKIDGEPRKPSPVSSSALDGRGSLYITRQKGLTKLDCATGAVRWEVAFGEAWSPATPCPDGDTVYAASGAGKVYALDAESGAERWQWEGGDDLEAMHPYRRAGKAILSSPRLNRGHLWIGSNDGRLVALDKRSGQLARSHDFGVAVTSSPVVADDRIFLAARDGQLYALNPG